MFDGWTDTAADVCSNPCCRMTWPRVLLRLGLFYVVLAAVCWWEIQYRNHGIELEARVELIGVGPKGSQMVRYHFRDPVTGLPRTNTVRLSANQKPPIPTGLIEYIPGDYPSSRLKVQTVPYCLNLFIGVNILFLAGAASLVLYLAWEANRPIRRRTF